MGTVNSLVQQVNETGLAVQPSVLVDQNGNPFGTLSSPSITESFIQNYIRNGQGFSVSPGQLASATNANLTLCPLSLFNPSNSGKSVLIYSISVFTGDDQVPGNIILRATTSDPGNTTGFTNSLTPLNLKLGGSASSASAWSSLNNASASVTPAGTVMAVFSQRIDTPNELLTNGTCVLLPSGAANGIELTTLILTATHQYSAVVRYIEF